MTDFKDDIEEEKIIKIMEKTSTLVNEIKKVYGKNSLGSITCICGEMAVFSIASNNHIRLNCPFCKLSIME